jgi:ADP-ribose pyrophosphatase YjhB (NUDIX family)
VANLRQRLFTRLEPLLLWLWRVVPFPDRLRQAFLELINPRFLIGVVALIVDERGRVLILEHTYRRQYPWSMPGGYLKAREDPRQGLAREVAEEVGLEVEVGEVLAVTVLKGYELDLLFRARVLGGTMRASAEIRAWRYVEPAELGQILPHQLTLLDQAGVLAAA